MANWTFIVVLSLTVRKKKLKPGEMVSEEKKMKALVTTDFSLQRWRAREAEITATQRAMQNPGTAVCGMKQQASH